MTSTGRKVRAAAGASRAERKVRKEEERARKAVDRFRTSARGLRSTFQRHFPDNDAVVESLVFHLAQVEAQLPNTVEAIRLARYPGAGNRNPRRMALGLWQNLSAVETHVRGAMSSLEKLANGEKHLDPDEAEAGRALDARGI